VASPTKFTNIVLRRGDELRYRTPGGGGFGDPHEREPERIREDIADGYVSESAAMRNYGMAPATEGAAS
jgi:N-methylhydantoinase B/oxoprolinase/acetone carboxylase alpha subunit